MIIPVYEPQVNRQVNEAPLKTASAPAEAFGTTQARALQGAGQMFGGIAAEAEQIFLKEQAKADDAAVLEASNTWSEQVTSYLNDPEKGLLNRRLKGAKGASEEAAKRFDEIEKETFKGLENDRQRNVFKRFVMQNRMNRLEGVAKHERDEFQKYRIQVTEDSMKTALSSIAANYQDNDLFQSELDRGENALLTLFQDQGEEITREKIKAFHSAAHEARLTRLLEDNPKGAEEYFKQNKDQIDGGRHAVWSEQIKKYVMVEWTQETADKLAASFGSESAVLRHIREKYSGEEENDLVTAVKTRFSEKKIAIAEAKQAREERFWDAVEGAESLPALDATLSRMGISPEKKRKGLRYFQSAMMQDFSMGADYASTEDEILGLGEKFKVPEVVVRRAINEHRAVFEGKAEDLALAAQSEDDFLEAIKKQGATEAQLRSAQSVFRKVHQPVYDEARKRAEMQEEWSIRDAIDTGKITNRTELLNAATMQPKEKIDSLKKYMEDSKDPAQTYVNAEVKRRFKEARLREEQLPMMMEAFLQRTQKITGDRAAEEKLKIADEMIKKEKTGRSKWFFWSETIPQFLVPTGFKYNADLGVWTNGIEKWVPPEEYLY